MSPDGNSRTRKIDVVFASGIAWSVGAKWVTQAFSWASVFIAARLLSRSDFGTAEMAGFFVMLANTLSEFGVGTAVLQMRELEPRVLAQLHSVTCLLTSAVFLLGIPASHYVALFFTSDPAMVGRLSTLIIVSNLCLLITGFQSVPGGLLQRDMDYRRVSLAEGVQAIIQALGLVIGAFCGLRYWSLLIGGLLGRAVNCAMVCSWKHLPFAFPRWKDVRAPLRMGAQASVSRTAWAAYIQSDGVIVGRVLGADVLGVYRMAMTLAAAPAEKISSLIMRACGPLFAQVQSDDTLGRRYCLVLTELLVLVELPLMIGLGLVAPEIVHIALEDKWAACVWPIRCLVLFMTIRTLSSLMDQILVSRRRTGFTMTMSLMNLFVMPIAFFVAAKWIGTIGVAAAWLAMSPLTVVPLFWKGLRSIHLPLRDLLLAVAPAVGAVATMAVCVGLLRNWHVVATLPVVVRLVLEVVAGAIVYIGFLLALFPQRVKRYVGFAWNLRTENAALLKGRL